MAKKLDKSTEDRIKAAAEKIFLEKGFSAARTRDIAEESGLNLALINYYFRSKENLYNIIMMEKLIVFFNIIIDVLDDVNLTILERADKIVNKYTDLLLKEPNLPFFLLSEIQQNPDFFASKLNIKEKLVGSKTIRNLLLEENKKENMHFLLSFLGITLFPFIVRNVFEKLYDLTESEFSQILNERRVFIANLLTEIYPKVNQLTPEDNV
ncbi:MAG: TetR family transcriptional regulator [Porphyromonadaceae bacterium]|jgi:AcrR family transcriptional regulator|nr:TetR family transcriptional regulator [Porphyromonadaceae bacterium]